METNVKCLLEDPTLFYQRSSQSYLWAVQTSQQFYLQTKKNALKEESELNQKEIEAKQKSEMQKMQEDQVSWPINCLLFVKKLQCNASHFKTRL